MQRKGQELRRVRSWTLHGEGLPEKVVLSRRPVQGHDHVGAVQSILEGTGLGCSRAGLRAEAAGRAWGPSCIGYSLRRVTGKMWSS